MGFEEIRNKLSEYVKNKQNEYKEAQALNESRDDYETTDKALRNKRREVRKYVDKDEKAQLEAYIRSRQAQEDRSWMNTAGMLDTQEINISRPTRNVFADNQNFHQIDPRKPTGNILGTPNMFTPSSNKGRKRR
jgi:hypothetical protein